MQYRIIEERRSDGKVFNYQVQMKFLFLWLPGSIGYSTLDAARKAVSSMSGTKTVVPNKHLGGIMKLWILSPVKNLPKNDDPWDPWYDKAFGFVVRAETESEARKLAMESAGDEMHHNRPWLDPKYSTCVELSNDGEIGVVMRDFASA